MKKFLLILAITASFGMVSQANALSYGDSDYVGLINDGIPSSLSAEVGYINTLIGLAPGAGPTACGSEICDRTGSTLTGLPPVTLGGAVKIDDPPTTTFDATGFEYILGKYDAGKAGSWVWYLGPDFVGSVTLPGLFDKYGLSHISAFSSGAAPVPEPATVLLLGVGLAGLLGFGRKKFFKK